MNLFKSTSSNWFGEFLTLSHLTLHHALAVSSDAADGVAGARRLPGALSGGAVVVEVPAARVPVGLPIAQNVERRSGGDRRNAGLGDLQLLEVGVDRWVRPTRTNGWCRLKVKNRGNGGTKVNFRKTRMISFVKISPRIKLFTNLGTFKDVRKYLEFSEPCKGGFTEISSVYTKAEFLPRWHNIVFLGRESKKKMSHFTAKMHFELWFVLCVHMYYTHARTRTLTH